MNGFTATKKALWVLCLTFLVGFVPKGSGLAEVTKAIKPKIIESYGNLPLSFEANQGQTDSQVKFLSRGSGYTLFLTPTEAVIVLRKPQDKKSALNGRPSPKLEGMKKSAPELETPNSKPETVVRMKLVGANSEPKAVGLHELPGKSNYFIGNDPKNWRTSVPTYSKVKYQNVYPGVDLVYYGNQRRLEYDFIVAPGADPRVIKLAFKGAGKVETDAEGDLVIRTAAGDLRMHRPLVYQEVAGVKKEISAAYILNPNAKSAIEDPKSPSVGFQLASYDRSKPLIIDPVLNYSTYLGGSGNNEAGNGIAVDSSGNAYVTGHTNSANFPITSGSFQTTFVGGSFGRSFDAFVTKINPTGSALIYSTYLGGSDTDGGNGIAVDSAGNAYITGSTSSNDFPTTPGAFQTGLAASPGLVGTNDVFITKLNPSGDGLIYSTYLGGNGFDAGGGLAVDAIGNAYISGNTTSSNFPTTPGSFQATFGGGCCDTFVSKLNAAGSALIYSTYLGGSGFDGGGGMAVDSAGHAYVSGTTFSANFPTTAGAFQPTFGGASDAFVTKLDATGSTLIYSTYLGGSGSEGGGIAVDSAGHAYVSGRTVSPDFPVTAGAFQTTFGGGVSGDVFVTKLNSAGSALIYSTYLGGSDTDVGGSIALDSSGNAYVTGQTNSINFPTTSGAPQTTFGGGVSDAFVTKINTTGSALIYSTYLGGSGRFDVGIDIAVDSSGSAYVTGQTQSADFPTISEAFQTTPGGPFPFVFVSDGFVAKIDLGVATPVGNNVVVQPIDEATGATPVTLTFSNVTQAGATSLTISDNAPVCQISFKLGDPPQVYDIATTAIFDGNITVCINYSGITFADESSLKLFHIENGLSVDRTTSLDTTNNIICATVTSLSPFACCEPVAPPALTVAIDIKPGSFPNSINPKSHGKIPVAILSSSGFSAPTQVDRTSLTFGHAGNEASLAFCNSKGEDVNRDGLRDLLCHFHTQAAQFQSGDTQGLLKGKTISGRPLTGRDSVRIVPDKKHSQSDKQKGHRGDADDGDDDDRDDERDGHRGKQHQPQKNHRDSRR